MTVLTKLMPPLSLLVFSSFLMCRFTLCEEKAPKIELDTVDHKGGVLGIYDGKEFVFTGSKYSLVMLSKLLWRYGYDVIRLNFFIQDLLSKFSRIYDLQDQGMAFTSTSGLLKAMSPKFEEMTHISTKAALSEAGFSEKFIKELVGGALMSNYGQTTNVQGFVGSVSIAGAEPGLWSVEGGNNRVPEGLIKEAKVNLNMAVVTDITLTGKQYEVQYLNKDSSSPVKKAYDIVIIATPFHQDSKKVNFHGFPETPKTYQDFHRTVATYVRGVPNISKFGQQRLDDLPTAILVSNPNLIFNSIGLQRPVDKKYRNPDGTVDKSHPVYKVFSQEPLSDEQLGELFTTIDSKDVVDWMAYPHYKSSEKLLNFQLHDQMYYLNSIELAASCMETSAIGGRNVALLAYNRWFGIQGKIDNLPKTSGGKTEL
ncbi:prenylcysteine oxidase isoform X2 [Lingula anatina]|uniref:Prenylcysteine oxidase isoform X2 n=1 Tax=Lingula anatina TaxID=7574 RepID=A0A1S3J9A3_LINAN|nr:prenylcysteine oxidase isoform X2 [Lingula anatina]|eukprot:XP_013406982.1 prenylcysteine oxidase isoform X2 [Lingula anatina]